MNLSLIIPVYNEEENLPLLYTSIDQALAPLKDTWEVIFVDDGSRDGSFNVLRSLVEKDPEHVRVLSFRRNFGQTAAIAAGLDHACGEIIVLLDADMQNDPADIPMLLAKLDEGYDLVSGWRKDRKDNRLTRTLPSNLANGLISWTTGVHLHDYGCTLKAYRRDVLEGFRFARHRNNEAVHKGVHQAAGVDDFAAEGFVALANHHRVSRFKRHFINSSHHCCHHIVKVRHNNTDGVCLLLLQA